MHKNFKNIDKVVFGRSSFNQLDSIIAEKRHDHNKYFLFIVDNYFKGKELEKRVPAKPEDIVMFINVDAEEPTTKLIDTIRDNILKSKGLPAGVVGIGGGSIMDIAKAVSLMFTNEGSSTLYQGLNLIKKPGIYHLGVPTVSGTGAECSMTAVLTGSEKKLGLKCEWTVFNQVILDPDLTGTVPKEQWFFTGMDTYIHCIESEKGSCNNTYSYAYAEEALKLCRDVFYNDGAGQNAVNDEKLMVASLMGGLSLTVSEVGICHAISYGLSKILHTRHCYSNCLVFQHLADFYPQGVKEFKEMLAKHNISLPENLSKGWTNEQIAEMAQVAYKLTHMWNHYYGADWRNEVTLDSIEALFRRL